MAYSNPNIPTVNIITMDPVTGLVLEGEVTGVPPSGAAYSGIFSLSCILIRTDVVGVYEMTGTVAVPAWTINGTGSGSPAAPLGSLQYNNGGAFAGTNSLYTPGAHPTRDLFEFGAVGDNAVVSTFADNLTALRVRGLDFFGANVTGFEGIFYNAAYNTLGNLQTRHIIGANVEMDMEVQSPNALLLTAVDDTVPTGKILAGSKTDFTFNLRADAEVASPIQLKVDRVSTVTTGVANTSDMNVYATSTGKLYLQKKAIPNGGVVMPSMTTAQRNAIVAPVAGEHIYNTTTTTAEYYDGSSWIPYPGTGGGSAYSLGLAAPFDGLAGGTITVSNPGLLVPTGDMTASGLVGPGNVTFGSGSFIVGPTAPQTAAVLALYNQLHALAATNPVDLSTGNISQSNIGYGLGVFVPGVYKSTAAVSVVAATTITLNGVGDYVFDIAAALTTGGNVNIVLTNGAQASRVYFVVGTITAGSSTTVGATNSLIGNFILGNGGVATTIGSTATIQGRLLSTGAEVILIDGNASSLFIPLS